MNHTERIQANQVAHTQAMLKAQEYDRLKVKLGYILGGAAVGMIAGALYRGKKPSINPVILGFIIGEYGGWVLHGLRYKKWFM